MHLSIPVANTMEYLNQTEVSPLISHANVKVCYVGQQPNRNRTVITKEVATEMGRKLPGSPVVGLFNKETKDFEEHSREIVIEGGQYQLVDITKPYGFVPPDAQVWFEKFTDDGVEHEYLCTECYIWTGAYPESKRILEQGNNQSMELSQEFQKGFWTNDANTGNRIFIYNEALIEKLCILGADVEPCFEGAQIKSQFSLENNPEFQEFKTTMFSMITELQNTLNKGGSPMENEFKKQENEDQEKKNPDTQEEKKPAGNQDDKKPEDDKKKKYSLEEVTEYQELLGRYNELQSQYTALMNAKSALDVEIAGLKEFKLTTERQEKQAMIDKFAMLSDEDKKDVVANIDTYSLDDIEAKLSVICVRNKVNFNFGSSEQEEKKSEDNPQGLFNLGNSGDDNVPAWIKAVRNNAANK